MKSIFMKLFIIGLCVSFFPIQAIAQGGQTGFFTIEALDQRQCEPNQGFEITLTADHTNPDDCSNPRVLELSCDEKWYLPSVAVFLTAFSLNKEVQMWVDGCDTDGQALVKAVQMRASITPPPPSGDVVKVFVTSVQYNGNLGGVDGGDIICQEAAQKAGLTGNDWTAWLSGAPEDEGTGAIDRIPDGQYLDMNENLIANDKTDLTDGEINAPIKYDENGDDIGVDVRVWTGTGEQGTGSDSDCNEWTSDGRESIPFEAFYGQPYSTDHSWTQHDKVTCVWEHSLYCFGTVN